VKRLYATALTLTLLGGCAAPTTRPIDVSSDVMAREAEKQKELALGSLAKDGERLFGMAFRLKIAPQKCAGTKSSRRLGSWLPICSYWNVISVPSPPESWA
jgi:hypothetical protein